LALIAWIGYQLDILPFWVWLVFLVLTPFSAWLGHDRYRSLGHTLTHGYLVSRSGSLVRETVALRSPIWWPSSWNRPHRTSPVLGSDPCRGFGG
jgi:hypothetical protein